MKVWLCTGHSQNNSEEVKMKNKISALTAVSFAALALSACGGGGGNSNNNSNGAPAASAPAVTSGNLQTSVPASTYATGTAQATFFTQLNTYRAAMGVGQLKQDSVLDTSAAAHALYLVNNFANGNITAVTHDEVSTNVNYYEATPLTRARKAGAPVTEFIGEDAAVGIVQATADATASNCFNQYVNTMYHLNAMMETQETVGVGIQTNTAQGTYGCVLDFGETTNVVGSPVDNGFYTYGGQQMATNAIAHSPLANETNVARAMVAETPNPAPDLAAPGRPILVRVNVSSQGDQLTVSSFTLSAANGSAVPARIIVPSSAVSGSTGVTADVNSNALTIGAAVLLPLAPLAANTTYTVAFSGQRDGTPISTTFTFTTGS
jgi:uncharacterized protein YkwD